jgi:hypothetical protein
VPNILVVNASVPARSLRELIDLAKSKPGTLNFASPGNGSGPHLAGELLKRMAGIDLTHVPYNGVAPAMNAVLAGDVQALFRAKLRRTAAAQGRSRGRAGRREPQADRRGAGPADPSRNPACPAST